MALGADFFASVLASGDVGEFLKLRPSEAVFLKTEADTFNAIHGHVIKYGSLPSLDAVEAATGGLAEISEEVPPDVPAYYYDQILERYIKRESVAAITEARAMMAEPGPDSAGKGLSWLLDKLSGTAVIQNGDQIIDLRDQGDLYIAEYLKRFTALTSKNSSGIEFGWPSMDLGVMGLQPGDVVSYVGRPGMGKTWMLLYSALHVWRTQGKAVAFVTMEMHPQIILDRLVSLDTKLAVSDVMNANLQSSEMKKMSVQVKSVWADHPAPFYVFDGAKAGTVSELMQVFRYAKVDAIFIDGAYMLENEDKRLGVYQKVGENVKLIKNELAVRLNVPVICSYQFNRDASTKSKKGGQIGLEDIGYSDAIGQYSSTVLGLLEDDTVESKVSRRMDVLKNRHGPPTSFRVRWDLFGMNFSEIHPPKDPSSPEQEPEPDPEIGFL